MGGQQQVVDIVAIRGFVEQAFHYPGIYAHIHRSINLHRTIQLIFAQQLESLGANKAK
jgi:hypothetical protein